MHENLYRKEIANLYLSVIRKQEAFVGSSWKDM